LSDEEDKNDSDYEPDTQLQVKDTKVKRGRGKFQLNVFLHFTSK
jgi:hypothetical protein